MVAAAAALLEVRQEEVVEVASALEEPAAEHVHSKQSQVAGACSLTRHRSTGVLGSAHGVLGSSHLAVTWSTAVPRPRTLVAVAYAER